MTTLVGIGSLLLAATSCAAAPWPPGAGLRDRAGAYDVEVLVDGVPAPTYGHDGETYVMGQLGARYTLRVHNRSDRRIEAVVSVDGRDVIDGKGAELRGKRGYLVPAYGQIDIDGWRISHSEAAAFRFSTVRDSYAARTGGAREVGVIGVAVFPERFVPRPRPLARPYPYPYPYPYPDRTYDMDPDSRRGDDLGGRGRAEEESLSSAEPPPPPAAPQRAPRSSAGADAPLGGRGSSSRGYGDRLAEKKAARDDNRPGLGTDYGEVVSSPTYEVEFVRANAARPSVVLGVRYNDREGLLAMGIDVDGRDWAWWREEDLRRTADPFPADSRRFTAPPPGWRR
ncbi:MAG TPA: hypothetical protein VFH68_10490 [Polyangia bacterium]|nr:hypothetical protein [Polyangia bacterium]